jgi:hypothetical protein
LTKDSPVLKDLVVKWTDLAMTRMPPNEIDVVGLVLKKIVDSATSGNENKKDLVEGINDFINLGEDQLEKLISAMKADSKKRWSTSFELAIRHYLTYGVRNMVYISRVNEMKCNALDN